MRELLTIGNVLWGTTSAAEIMLLALLLRLKLVPSHSMLAFYIASTILQSILAVFVYATWGMRSPVASKVIWGSQAIVITMRFLAVYEIARRILSPFEGIWMLARRIILVIGVSTLAYSLLSSQRVYSYLVLNLDRGLELSIALFIVVMLLFARCYYLPLAPLDRALCVGFCLYSCVYVINDSMLERYWNSYQSFWSYLGIYGSLSPELNFRFKHLNDQLSSLLQPGKQRS